MTSSFRLFGAETSAFSTKLRSYLRYKDIEHEWIPRTVRTEADLRAAARFDTLPVLVTSTGYAVHDTTPTIEALETDKPTPEILPSDPACAYLSAVLEDYADLWLSKAVVHYRWGRKKDQKEAAARAIEEYFVDGAPENRKDLEKVSIDQMVERMALMGLDKDMGAVIEKSLKRFVKLLNTHLETRLCIFGGRPSLADFGIAAQLGQLMKDPTPAKIIEKEGPFVTAWIDFMADPKPNGPFESLDTLESTLKPVFSKELALGFLPWAAANLEAALAREAEVEATIGKDVVRHPPLKSAARSFRDTRRKLTMIDDADALRDFLEAAGALAFLLRPDRVRPEKDEASGDGQRGKRRRKRRSRPNEGADAVVAEEGETAVPDDSGKAAEAQAGQAETVVGGNENDTLSEV